MEMIPKGYQMTEVGVIPEDWEVVELNDLFTFQGGSQPPRHTFVFEEKDGFVRLLQIRDYKSDRYASYIPKSFARRSCTKDDIMIGRYGPPIFQILRGLEGAYNVALIKAIPKVRIAHQLAWHVLNLEPLFDFVNKLSQRSSGQTGVDLLELKKYQLPLPTKQTEQTAIATVLSDMDALIGGLERLIAKKRAVKEGAMQVLLTGKVRLEGFEGEWSKTELGSVGRVIRGASPRPQGDPRYYGGDIPRLMVEDVTRDGKFVTPSVDYLTEDGSKKSRPCKAGTLTIVCSGTVGIPSILAVDACIHDGFLALVDVRKEYSIDFLFHLMTILRSQFDQSATHGGVFTNLTTSVIKEFEVVLPKFSEQIAIAQILSDMDAEIGVLEAKLSKYRLVKEGMMGELLTGKTRLNHD